MNLLPLLYAYLLGLCSAGAAVMLGSWLGYRARLNLSPFPDVKLPGKKADAKPPVKSETRMRL